LIGNGVGFRPLGKIVHNDLEVSVSLVTPWEGPCYVDSYPFERGPEVVLMHFAPIPGSGVATGCIGVSQQTPFLNIVSFLEPVVSSPDSFRVLLTPKLPPDSPPCSSEARRLLRSDGELSGLFLIVRRLIPSGALVCQTSQRGISIGPVAFLRGAAVGDVFLFWALSGLHFLQSGSYVLVIQLFCSQSDWTKAGYGYICNSSYLLDVPPRLEFVAVGKLFLAW
jgi:hypothetical protein